MTGKVIVDNRLFGDRLEGAISIVFNTPLGNPFKIGEANCVTGSKIWNEDDLTQAYADWTLARIRMGNPVTINALDDIGYQLLAGQDVVLSCGCGKDYCHGFWLKQFIEGHIDRE